MASKVHLDHTGVTDGLGATLTEHNLRLAGEATALLQSGLRDALAEYGRVEPMGSYALGLMAWRDLDVYVVRENLDRKDFFALGARLGELLCPVRMSYRDEITTRTAGLPQGLYWGVYLGDERAGAWKIDIWAVDEEQSMSARRELDELASRLSPETSSAIIGIKERVWQQPGYRKTFSGWDIYDAVLNFGVQTADEFLLWLSSRGVHV